MNIKKLVYESALYMHDNYSEPIGVTDISAQAHLSPSYFAAVFRILTGFTVKNYFNRYRLYRAAAELVANSRRIIDIAFDVGFLSQESFTRSFSKAYGITPAQFRLTKPPFDPFPPVNLFKWKDQQPIEFIDIIDRGKLAYGK